MASTTERKLIMANKLIAGLLELGIVDNCTRKVTITAEMGEPVTLTLERFGDDRLLEMLDEGYVVVTRDQRAAFHTLGDDQEATAA